MPGPVFAFLADDHARLDGLLRRAMADPAALDLEAYETFRKGLLRHIAMEEKVLLRVAREKRGSPLPQAARLRADHGALAALMVPTPTHEILALVVEILGEHNPIEEGPGGVYELCEELAGAEVDEVLARLQAVPEVPAAPHFDGPRAAENIARLLRERRGG